jgi:predicted nucleotidyltransferase
VKIENEQIAGIKREILGVLNEMGVSAKNIILFGSRARGDFTSQSDWDFLIVLKQRVSREEKRKIAHRVRKRLAEFYLACDVIVRSEAEVEDRKSIIGSVVKSVMEEGLPI